MNWKSSLLKPLTALAIALLTATPWAADEQKLYCVNKVDVEDGKFMLQLSQQFGNYTPVDNEKCFEQWYTDGQDPSVHETVAEYLNGEDQLILIQLTSDIDFGGYDDQSGKCVEEFRQFQSEKTISPVLITSMDGYTYTIRGLCYINMFDGATFGGDVINSITNVYFKNIHLESTQFAGLIGEVGTATVTNVSIENATVRAPIAGVLAGTVYSLNVTDFFGTGIMVNSVFQPDLNGLSIEISNDVRIGGLAGTVNDITVLNASLEGPIVSNNPTVLDDEQIEDPFSQLVDQKDAYVGGVVGRASSVNLSEVGINAALLTDRSTSVGKNTSYLGGLVGGVMSVSELMVRSTYSFSDITCSYKDKTLCVAGYIAGRLNINQEPGSDIRLTSNFHYTQNTSDVATGMVGEAYCNYVSNFGQDAVNCGSVFNSYGWLPLIDNGGGSEELVNENFAYGNFRSTISTLEQTSGFDEDSYTFYEDGKGTYMVGVIDTSYMKAAAFANVLNEYNQNNGSGTSPWIFDDSHPFPYMAAPNSQNGGGSNFTMYRVSFALDCIMSGCLTDDEVAALAQFSSYQVGSYAYEFPTDEYGAIANQDWLDFAADLQKPNSERDDVHWANGTEDEEAYKEFATNNKYSFDVFYKLEVGQAEEKSEEVMAYAFFGAGIDFDKTIVELSSYDGDSIENRGSEIDKMSYSGADEPVVMPSGSIMRIYAIDPVTTDGSEFMGWVVKAAYTYKGDMEEIRRAALGGMNIPVDEDGYFDLGEYEHELFEKFKDESLDDNSGATDMVLALAIFPKGFEKDSSGSEPVEVVLKYPALLQSGNAIQLAVKTDKFVKGENDPFVSVLLQDLNGEPLKDEIFEFKNGEWPEVFTWEKYPLAPGRYLMTAKIYDGTGEHPDVREWDFEVKSQIADECGDCWYMVSLSNVVLAEVEPSDVNVLYWWNEQSMNGKYWQYEEVESVSDVDRTRGYWYNSIEALPLELDGESLEDDYVTWELDSVYSGWNMVRNPFGWYIDVSELQQKGYEIYRWDSKQSNYVPPHYVKPYEAFWVRAREYEVIKLPSTPVFADTVDMDGNTVSFLPLQKKQVLAKAAGTEDWNVQLSLFDAKGKADTWNVLGVGKVASVSDEPPEGMGDHVNLAIVDAGRRLAKSVKEENNDAEYEWNVVISATSLRMGYLKVAGVDALRAYGLRAFLTIDGVTTELNDDGEVQVNLSSKAKVATLRIAKAARKVVVSTLQGLRAHDLGATLQVGFDASEGLAGANARVDLVDMKGHVVSSESFKAENGRNEVSLERPVRGLYALRAVVGREVAIQKILLK